MTRLKRSEELFPEPVLPNPAFTDLEEKDYWTVVDKFIEKNSATQNQIDSFNMFIGRLPYVIKKEGKMVVLGDRDIDKLSGKMSQKSWEFQFSCHPL